MKLPRIVLKPVARQLTTDLGDSKAGSCWKEKQASTDDETKGKEALELSIQRKTDSTSLGR